MCPVMWDIFRNLFFSFSFFSFGLYSTGSQIRKCEKVENLFIYFLYSSSFRPCTNATILLPTRHVIQTESTGSQQTHGCHWRCVFVFTLTNFRIPILFRWSRDSIYTVIIFSPPNSRGG